MSDQRTPIPDTVKLGVGLAWLVFAVGLGSALWSFLAPGSAPWLGATRSPVRLFLAAGLMLLTPMFFGHWVHLVMLILITRRRGWPRWVLAAGVVVGVVLPLVSSRAVPRAAPFAVIWYTSLVLRAVAVALLFTASSNAWFRRSAPEVPV